MFKYVITHSGFPPPLYLFKKSFLLKGQVLFLSRRSYLFFDILVGRQGLQRTVTSQHLLASIGGLYLLINLNFFTYDTFKASFWI